MEAQVTVHRAGESPQELRIEVPAQNFRRRPEVTLVSRLQDSDIDREEAERIEVKIRGERLTLKQTGWEIQR
jgi:translation initiation factor 1 (eIF-1/SUI1)